MANTFNPFGFQPVQRVDGAAWSDKVSVRKILSTNTHYIFRGDPVASVIATHPGYIDVYANGSLPNTNQIAGVFWGCEYLSVSKGYVTWSPFFPGGDTVNDVIAYVIDDPNVVFRVQTNNSAGGATAAGLSTIYNGAGYAPSSYAAGVWSTGGTIGTSSAGNTYNGMSGVYLDQNTFSTATTYPFLIYDIPNVQTSGNGLPSGTTVFSSPGNGYDATTAYNVAYVVMNNSGLKAAVTPS